MQKIWKKNKFMYCLPLVYGAKIIIIIDVIWAVIYLLYYSLFIFMEKKVFNNLFDLYKYMNHYFGIGENYNDDQKHDLIRNLLVLNLG